MTAETVQVAPRFCAKKVPVPHVVAALLRVRRERHARGLHNSVIVFMNTRNGCEPPVLPYSNGAAVENHVHWCDHVLG